MNRYRQQRGKRDARGIERKHTGLPRHPEEFPRSERSETGKHYGEHPIAEVHNGDARGRGDDREDDAPCQLRHGLDFHDFCFFPLQQLIDPANVVVVEFLKLFLRLLLIVL